MMEDEEVGRLPSSETEANLEGWSIKARRSKILASVCECVHRPEEPEPDPSSRSCQLCLFRNQLQFPHMPDMVFPGNILNLEFVNGGKIEFTALDALKCIDINRPPIQVACAEEWQESRSGTDRKVKPFDWTFITNYKGTLLDGLELTPTTDKINIELLKRKEKIIFYEDIPLYEDELHDHGVSSCSVKIRVMPSCWFILLRYFLRVDDVLSEINDTRMFYQFETSHILIENTLRKGSLIDLKLSPHIVTEPNELSQHLPLVSQTFHKVVLPIKS